MRILVVACLALSVVAGCGDGDPDADGGTNTAQSDCHVRFALTEGALTGDLQAVVDYGRTSGHFVGVNTAVECVRIDTRASVFGANQCTGAGGECRSRDRAELYIVAQTIRPLPAPLELLECHFVGSKSPEIDDFRVVDVIATDEDSQEVHPPPTVSVTAIDCKGPTSTTTTLPEHSPCDDRACGAGEACVDGACVGTDRYLVEFRTDVAATYASIDVRVTYDCRDGWFNGLGGGVACSPPPGLNVFSAFNNRACPQDGGETSLSAGMMSLVGWAGPGPLMACEYESATGSPPPPASFRVEVEAADTLDGKPVKNPTASVSRILPIAP